MPHCAVVSEQHTTRSISAAEPTHSPTQCQLDYSTPTQTRDRERHTQNDKKAPNPNTMLITSCVYRSRFCDGSYGFLCLSFPPDATVSAAVAADCVRDMVSSVTTAFCSSNVPQFLSIHRHERRSVWRAGINTTDVRGDSRSQREETRIR